MMAMMSQESQFTISRVDEMMASGQILPIRFPDPGKCLADDSSPKTVALTLTLTPFRSPTLPQASPRVSAPTASQS